MPKTLLLADDSVTIQKAVAIIFAHEDYAVTSVGNGDDAIRKVQELQPDIILADVAMPGKNGYEVCEAVKGDPSLQHIPVLLLAGTFEPIDEGRAQAAQADGHIAKPFESAALLERVKSLSGGGDGAQPAAARAPAPAGMAFHAGGARPGSPGAGAAPSAPRSAGPAGVPGVGGRPGAAASPLGAMPRPGGPAPMGPGGAPKPGGPAHVPPVGLPRPGTGMHPGPRPGAPMPGGFPPVGAPKPGGPIPGGFRPMGPTPGAVPPQGVPRPGAPIPGAIPGGMARPGAAPAAVPAAGLPRPGAPLPGAAPRGAAPMGAPAARPARDPFGLAPVSAPASAAEPENAFELGLADDGMADSAPLEPAAAPRVSTSGGGSEALLREALSKASQEMIERIVWEVVPQLAETLIREELDRLIKERESGGAS